jgi:plasmid stabilization system protein ParE
MIYTFQFHNDIALDYIEGYDWYESQTTGLGEKFLLAIRKKLEQIAQHPETFSTKSNLKYREAKVDTFPYLIVYKIHKQHKIIFVSSIHHAKKHPRNKYRK